MWATDMELKVTYHHTRGTISSSIDIYIYIHIVMYICLSIMVT